MDDAVSVVALVLAGAVSVWQLVVVKELRAIRRRLEELSRDA
jgi:hypothetical protein